MQAVSCTNIHHEVTDLVKLGMIENAKTEYLESAT